MKSSSAVLSLLTLSLKAGRIVQVCCNSRAPLVLCMLTDGVLLTSVHQRPTCISFDQALLACSILLSPLYNERIGMYSGKLLSSCVYVLFKCSRCAVIWEQYCLAGWQSRSNSSKLPSYVHRPPGRASESFHESFLGASIYHTGQVRMLCASLL
jgi:hypothetical protein